MLRPANDSDMEMMRAWRNAPNVRAISLSDLEITPEEHLAWWQAIQHDDSRLIFIFEEDGNPLAVINYFDIDPVARSCYWGFYMAPADTGDPYGRFLTWLKLEKQAIRYAFENLDVEQLYCEVLSTNREVVMLNQQFGFKTIRSYEHNRSRDTVEVQVMLLRRQS